MYLCLMILHKAAVKMSGRAIVLSEGLTGEGSTPNVTHVIFGNV